MVNLIEIGRAIGMHRLPGRGQGCRRIGCRFLDKMASRLPQCLFDTPPPSRAEQADDLRELIAKTRYEDRDRCLGGRFRFFLALGLFASPFFLPPLVLRVPACAVLALLRRQSCLCGQRFFSAFAAAIRFLIASFERSLPPSSSATISSATSLGVTLAASRYCVLGCKFVIVTNFVPKRAATAMYRSAVEVDMSNSAASQAP